jgi:hypothetical protein
MKPFVSTDLIHPANDTKFRRRDLPETSQRELGYVISRATLSTLAVRGGGPPYSMIGGVAYYRWGDFVAWVKSRSSATRTTTSEGKAFEERAARDRAWYRARDSRAKASRAAKRGRATAKTKINKRTETHAP